MNKKMILACQKRKCFLTQKKMILTKKEKKIILEYFFDVYLDRERKKKDTSK